MKKIGKTTILVVLALVLALGALGVFGIIRATAVTPGQYLVEGNPNCGNLYQATVISGPDSDLLDLGPLLGFKYDANPTGDASSAIFNNGHWVKTSSQPDDLNNSVSISNVVLSSGEGVQFDWSATLGLDAVIVKAQDANAYVYAPEAFGASGLVAPSNKAISHIEFCYDYELTAEKTADATWYKTIDWTLTKDVTPASADKFIGQSAQYDYTVTLNKSETFGPWIVEGDITIKNPSPYTVDFGVADSVGSTPVAVDCGGVTSLAPNDGAAGGSDEVTCSYSLSSDTELLDGTNTATITSSTSGVGGATATDDYAFGDPLLTEGSEPEEVTANDTLKGDLGSFSESGTAEYSLTQDCSAEPDDYAGDGKWSNTYPNTAEINETTGDSDSETVTLNCYAPVIDKDATATWYRDVDWSITKDVTPASADKFIGESATYNYVVTLTKWESDEYDVSGTIDVINPTGSPGDMTVSLVDMLDATTAATVDCGEGATSVTVAPGATESCSYTGDLDAKADGTNEATGTFLGYDFVATYPYAFGAATYLPGAEPETVTANDTLKGALGSFSASGVANYSLTQDCSDNPADYAGDGIWSDTYPNTASIVETTGDSDSETVTLTCYAPIVDKDATATWYRDVQWSITKDVTPPSADKFIGESATYNYVVTLTKWESDEYDVSGTIDVSNPSGSPGDMTVSLVDMLDATTAATVDCDPETEGDQATVTVATGETEYCSYTGDLAAKADGTNTATGTFLGYDFVATYGYAFGAATYLPGAEPEDVTATDTLKGALGSFSGSDTVTYSLTQDCSADPDDYEGDGYWYMDYPNTASINETTGDSDSETVRLNCYAPVVEKDADGSYDEYHDWTVDKSVDPTQQSAFAGDTVGFDWTVTVEEEVWEENFGVTGQINVYNPAPMPMTVLLSDVLDDSTVATITGCSDTGVTWDGTYLYIPAGITAVCDYTATPGGGPGLNNFAAALPDQVQFKVQYPYSGGDAYFPTVTVAGGTVLDGTYDGWCIDTDHTIANNTWYNANVYSSYEDMTGKVDYPENMDLVNWILNQDFVYQVSPGCSGGYTYGDVQRAIWTLVDPNSTSGLGSWSQCRVDEILAGAYADGEGFVPDCNDYIAVVLESQTGEQVIAVTQVTMIEVDLDCPAENTATVTLNDIDFSASAEIEWTVNVVHEGVTLDDDQNPAWPIDLTDGGEWTYADSYQCSLNPEDYVDGGGTTYQAKIENTATLYDGDEFLDDGYAYTLVDCYIPTIEKTAAGTYDERHEWTVEKEVTPLTQGGFPGDVLPWTWTVYVYEDVYEEDFDVAGTITVGNPNPDDVLVVALSDVLSDGTPGVIDQTSCAFDGTNLTVQPNSSETCNYEANDLVYSDDEAAPDNNTASIVLNGITFSDDDAIEWTANRIRENATLTDDEIGLNESLTGHGQAGSYTFGPYTGSDSHTCSSNRADYFVEGVYTQMKWTLTNWAYVHSDDVLQDSDDATTTYTCDASFVDIYKTTNGEPADPEDDIQFVLYSYDEQPPNADPKLRVPTEEEIVSTLNNGPNLYFQTALVPGDGYTICEYPVPAAYTFEISVNGDLVLTYAGPPGEENPTGEIQCFDFTAEPAGTTVTFNVNNRYPGGAPRTPGYWKNWNRCSGGNQADTADKLNNYLGPINGAGVFLLDDLLPQTIGEWEITTCEVGILILDTRNLDGDNMNNDAAYTLATALLAARLNQDAGACDPDEDEWMWEFRGEWLTFEQVLTAANNLLVGEEFDGTGRYLGPGGSKTHKALRADALYLYGIIDDYNNSLVCTGEESH